MGYKFSSADLLVVLALGIAWTRRDEILRNYRARGDKSPLDPLAPVKPFASSTSDALPKAGKPADAAADGEPAATEASESAGAQGSPTSLPSIAAK